jgi:hypothetical protein
MNIATRCPISGPGVLLKRNRSRQLVRYPCGGGIEYLHCDPASRRRRRKGKSQIWDSEIWSRVPRDSGPRKTALARASSMYKRQTRPLVREGAPHNEARNCQTVINIWSWAPDGARHQDLLTDWPSVAMCLWLWLWLELVRVNNQSVNNSQPFSQLSAFKTEEI